MSMGNAMIKRNKQGKLEIDVLGLQIFFGDLYEVCETEEEVERISELLSDINEDIADERLSEIEE